MTRLGRVWMGNCGIAVAAVLAAAAPGRSDTATLVRMVPEQANVLMLIDVKGLHDSPLGVKEGWSKRHESRYLEGATSFPPTTRSVVLAAQLNPGTLHNNWEIGLVELSTTPAISAIAKAEGGKIDRVSNVEVAWSPRNAFFAKLAPNTVGIMAPADRQALSRWLRSKPEATRVSEYLRAAAEISQEGQIVMAIDLDGVLAMAGARNALERSPTLSGKASDLDTFAKLIASLKGVTFAVQVQDGIIGRMRVDFGESAEVLGQYAKPLLLEVLANKGAMIDDFQEWSQSFDGSSVSLQGKLSEAGMRQLLSLIQLPSEPLGERAAAGEAASPGNLQATASHRYFKSATTLLDELRELKGKTQGQNALWHEKYAEKIDRLPQLNVDDALLAWGDEVSQALRDIALTLRNVGIRTSALQANTYGWHSNYGYYNQYDAGDEKRRIKRQETAAGVNQRFQIWKVIDNKTSDIRREMTKKYGVEF